MIHPRREPFEHGLLPIPRLIFSDPTQTLISLKQKLLESSPNQRVDSAAISESLQISTDHARLVLDTLASVLPSDSEPLVTAGLGETESVGVDVHDLVLFLYIQSYKRLLPRTHKDSAAVADVWPSTSAFDGYLSALSPLQVNSPFSLPSILSMPVNALLRWCSDAIRLVLCVEVLFWINALLNCGVVILDIVENCGQIQFVTVLFDFRIKMLTISFRVILLI